MSARPSLTDVPWDRLACIRICFGHQSVGKNLIDGLVMNGEQRLNVVESSSPDTFRQPVFAHFRVGRNGDPLTKLKDFESVMMSGVGELADVAFFKLCYVDITPQTDIHNLFETYHRMMESLAKTYPSVTFLHVTVPLRCLDRGVVNWIKQKWGRDDRDLLAQAQRHAYNELLRATYGPSGRLFDLAAEETTYPGGQISTLQYRGKKIPNLVPDYTSDGGHLTQTAAEHIMARLLTHIGLIEEGKNDR